MESTVPKTFRLIELDALRGIAAVLVMLFHYTAKYQELYGHETPLAFSLPWGQYGVNLFFMISGFVIFMTLHRIVRPLDFIVSRFSRLFPAFWAAVTITFLLVRWLELPDKTVDISTAGLNLFMIHGLFRIPHVDSVYWTLEIELIFYAMALALYLAGWLDRVHTALASLLALRLVYFMTERFAGIELSWTLSHLLILPYIAWFVCGIMIYRRATFPDATPRQDITVLAAAIGQLAIVEGMGIGLLAASLSILLWSASTGRLHLLANPVLAWMGAISYTLYLLHENIGWGIILQLERAGIEANLAILGAIIVALALATLLTWTIERPAMRLLRNGYRRRDWPAVARWRSIMLIGLIMTVFSSMAYAWHRTHPKQAAPGDNVANIFRPTGLTPANCPFDTQPRPLMILVLGQSNAGNHGELFPDTSTTQPTTFFFEGKCYRTTGPAPGATGEGGNLWSILGPDLTRIAGREVVFSILAVESTRIRDWTANGRLLDRLVFTLADQRQHGFVPDLVLWQQGEADARTYTTHSKYLERLNALVAILRNGDASAPLVAALSTRCRNNGSEAIRRAIGGAALTDASIFVGPDTDALADLTRRDGCHFSATGLHAAANLWREALTNLIHVEAIPGPVATPR